MKKNKTNFFKIFGTILLILFLLIILYFVFGTQQATFTYSNQCSLSSCPSGYSEVETYCKDTTNKCYKVCEKEIDGYCGSYGSFNTAGSIKTGNYNSGTLYSTNSYSTNNDYCYKFYSVYSYSVLDKGSASSFNPYTYVYSSSYSNDKCSTSTSSSVTSDTYVIGRGTGNSIQGVGRVTEYGGSTCSGGSPLFKSSGTYSLALYVSKANWNDESTDTKTITCEYECNENSDCGTNEYIGNKYCKDGNVFQKYRTYTCNNFNCDYSDNEQLISTCSAGCLNGVCLQTECSIGDEKCEGTTYYTCISNKWVSQGKVIGKCSYSEKYTLGENQLVAMESFYGGSTISRTSTRYPVINFVSILPTIIMDSTSNSVMTDKTIYTTLDNGGTYQIPLDQTWSLFYIIENNYQLPTVCDVVNVETGLCTSINPGIVTICSEGQFDASLGLCVIQPESSIVCPEGGRYDTSQGLCVFNPPLQAVCPEETVYNVNTEKCEYTPATSAICDGDYIYNSVTNKCEKYPESQINCPSSYAYDLSTDKCLKYPSTLTICPVGSIYSSSSNSCEYTPSSTYVCQTGFTYNSNTNKCEYIPSQEIICGIGTYDSTKNVCIYEPQTSAVCNKGVLTQIGDNNYACIYTPETIEKCPTGSTYNIETDKCERFPSSSYICESGFEYNEETSMCEVNVQIVCLQGTYDDSKKACVYSPNMEYLCINGELTYSGGDAKCIITPEASIVCPEFWTYNSQTDKCEKYPDIEETESKLENIIITALLSIVGLILFMLLILFLLNKRKKRK